MATVTHRTAKLQRFLIILKDHTPSPSEKTLNSRIPLEDIIFAKQRQSNLSSLSEPKKPETPNPQTLLPFSLLQKANFKKAAPQGAEVRLQRMSAQGRKSYRAPSGWREPPSDECFA